MDKRTVYAGLKLLGNLNYIYRELKRSNEQPNNDKKKDQEVIVASNGVEVIVNG